MDNEHVSRRQFMHKTAAAAAGLAVGLGAAGHAADAATDTSKIPSYNANMEYRRLGKTNIMVSAVGLGGHSRSNLKERTEIISRCLDAGINYIDACWDNEVKRDAAALRGRRDKAYLALEGSDNPSSSRPRARPEATPSARPERSTPAPITRPWRRPPALWRSTPRSWKGPSTTASNWRPTSRRPRDSNRRFCGMRERRPRRDGRRCR